MVEPRYITLVESPEGCDRVLKTAGEFYLYKIQTGNFTYSFIPTRAITLGFQKTVVLSVYIVRRNWDYCGKPRF